MFIGIAKLDLVNHNVFEKQYTIKKGQRFLGRDGILFNEYRAEMIDILKTVDSKDDSYLDKEYLELENDANKEYIDVELNGEDAESYKKLKAENEKLKAEEEKRKAEEEKRKAEEEKRKRKV